MRNFYLFMCACLTLVAGGCSDDVMPDADAAWLMAHGDQATEHACGVSASADEVVCLTDSLFSRMQDYYAYSIREGDTPWQMFWQGESGLATFYGEMPSSDNFITFSDSFLILYFNMEEGYLSSGRKLYSVWMWDYCYAQLWLANRILASLDSCGLAPEEKEFVKGQVLAMRAHLNWRLLQTFGPRWEDSRQGTALTVVNLTTPEFPEGKSVAPMNEILDQCYTDLDASLAAFSKAGSCERRNTWEPDRRVACGIYARVAALRHDWEKCRDMAHEAARGLSAPDDAHEFNGYMEYNDNEWLWAPSFDQDDIMYGNWCTSFACNGYEATSSYGMSTQRINKDLYDLIPATDSRRGWWLGTDDIPNLNLNHFYNKKLIHTWDDACTFGHTILINPAKEWLATRRPPLCEATDSAYYGKTSECNIALGVQVKFWCSGKTGEKRRCQVPYMRASEMMLYEAEACAELGDNSRAQALLYELNHPRNPQYTCALTGSALLDEVRLYRRIELWGEGFNWFDLKRWNLPMVRRAWAEGLVNSTNIPSAYECRVPTDRNNGWRHGIPQPDRYNTQAIP